MCDQGLSMNDGLLVSCLSSPHAGLTRYGEGPESSSAVAPSITPAAQRQAAPELRRLMAAHRDNKDLIDIGAYVPGSNPMVDRAVSLAEPIRAFLTQDINEIADTAVPRHTLHTLMGVAP